MTLRTILAKLESLGDAKLRAQNAKRGVEGDQFGVKLGEVRKIAATIKKDHALALELWETGIYEARLLAILILEPAKLSATDLDAMVRAHRTAWIADWLSSYVIKEHPAKEALRAKWMTAKDPWAARAGWSLTAGRVTRDAAGLDLPALLDRIETEMPGADPATQWTMNSCLAAIGINHPALRKRAIALGEAMGIYREYPVSKGCTSPFAPVWIAEMVKRGAS